MSEWGCLAGWCLFALSVVEWVLWSCWQTSSWSERWASWSILERQSLVAKVPMLSAAPIHLACVMMV